MTLHLSHPIALEPARAAAAEKYRRAIGGQRRRALKRLQDETAKALRESMEARDEND
jgi:hypothetical protein